MMELKKFTVLVIGVFLITSALSIIISVPTVEAASKDSKINPTVVEGSDDLLVNESETFVVEIRGAFRADGELVDTEEADNWTLKTESELDASIEPEESESEESNVFNVTITVHEEGEGDLTFTGYCGKYGEVFFAEKTFSISVETPERTTLPITNPSDTHIEEAKLGLFVDGELKATKTIEDLGPNEEIKVTFAWSKQGLSAGEHSLEVWMDYGGQENDEFTKDEKVMPTTTFEIEEEMDTWVYAAVAIAVIVGGFFIFIWYQKRKRKRRRPW